MASNSICCCVYVVVAAGLLSKPSFLHPCHDGPTLYADVQTTIVGVTQYAPSPRPKPWVRPVAQSTVVMQIPNRHYSPADESQLPGRAHCRLSAREPPEWTSLQRPVNAARLPSYRRCLARAMADGGMCTPVTWARCRNCRSYFSAIQASDVYV